MDALLTERMLLRRWQASDAPAMLAINRDAEVVRHLNRPLDEQGAAAFFEQMLGHWSTHGFGPWALESREPQTTGRFLGFAGLAYLPPFLSAAGAGPELGWRLDRSVWGRGLATEAARAAGDDALGRLGYGALISIIHPDNVRSRRVATKLGMRRDGTVENPALGLDVEVWRLSAHRSSNNGPAAP